jgi:hypothetical protein
LHCAPRRELAGELDVDGSRQGGALRTGLEIHDVPGQRRCDGAILEQQPRIDQPHVPHRQRESAPLFSRCIGDGFGLPRLCRARAIQWQLQTLGRAPQPYRHALDNERVDRDGACEQRKQGHAKADAVGFEAGLARCARRRDRRLQNHESGREEAERQLIPPNLLSRRVARDCLQARTYGFAPRDAREQDGEQDESEDKENEQGGGNLHGKTHGGDLRGPARSQAIR